MDEEQPQEEKRKRHKHIFVFDRRELAEIISLTGLRRYNIVHKCKVCGKEKIVEQQIVT